MLNIQKNQGIKSNTSFNHQTQNPALSGGVLFSALSGEFRFESYRETI